MTEEYSNIKGDLAENVKKFKKAYLHLKNIIDGERIKRFTFTRDEIEALDFALRVIDASIQEIEEE